MRGSGSWLAVGLILAACGKGGDKGGKAGGGGVAATGPGSLTLDYKATAYFLTVLIKCPENARIRLVKPVGVRDERMGCNSEGGKLYIPISFDSEAIPTAEVEVAVTADGKQYSLKTPLLPNSDNVDWLSDIFKIAPVDGEAASPGVTVQAAQLTRRGPASIAGGKLRFQLMLPAGSGASIDGKEVAFKTGVASLAGPHTAMDGGVFTRTITEDTAKGVVEIDLGNALADAELSGEVQVPGHTYKFHNAAGEVTQSLLISLDVGAAAHDVEKGPVWFVKPESKPARSVVLIDRTDKQETTKVSGTGKLSELGVAVVLTRGGMRNFSTCQYGGGYKVERVGHDAVVTAYDPRTGKMLGTQTIAAKAPPCARAIGVTSSTAAVQGSGSFVDDKVVMKWGLSLLK